MVTVMKKKRIINERGRLLTWGLTALQFWPVLVDVLKVVHF
jgi:hypothetical protein